MNVILRPALVDEEAFAFEVKRDAMGTHIVSRWGWDEDFQRQHHAKRWTERSWYIVLYGQEAVGTIALDWYPTHLQFGEFYILSQYRGQGLGTQVLSNTLEQADAKALETRLEFLKWNPVRGLYLRHGFRVVAETDKHYIAVRPPNAA